MAVLASTGRLAPASCTLARCAGARQMSACARASAGCSGSARQLGGGRRAVPPPPAAAPAALRQHKARSSTRVHAAVQQQPQQPPEQQQQPVDRRGLLALLAAANVALAAPQQAAAAAAVKPPPTPLPVPPLTETFMSSEGFAFDYPGDGSWVVAFDRSGSTGNGAVVVVGDFRKLITVSVFRTEGLPASVEAEGLTEDNGYEACVRPVQTNRDTMRFGLLRQGLVNGAYEYEFSLESCAGEIEEGLGGRLRCLSAFGGVVPTAPRRVIGRAVINGRTAYSINASIAEDRWIEAGPILQAVVSTFRNGRK